MTSSLENTQQTEIHSTVCLFHYFSFESAGILKKNLKIISERGSHSSTSNTSKKHPAVHCSLRGGGNWTEKTHITAGDQIGAAINDKTFFFQHPTSWQLSPQEETLVTHKHIQLWYYKSSKTRSGHCKYVMCVTRDTPTGKLLLGCFSTHTRFTHPTRSNLSRKLTWSACSWAVAGSWGTHRNPHWHQENTWTAQRWLSANQPQPFVFPTVTAHYLLIAWAQAFIAPEYVINASLMAESSGWLLHANGCMEALIFWR